MICARCILSVPNEIIVSSLVDSDRAVIGAGKVWPQGWLGWARCHLGRFTGSYRVVNLADLAHGCHEVFDEVETGVRVEGKKREESTIYIGVELQSALRSLDYCKSGSPGSLPWIHFLPPMLTTATLSGSDWQSPRCIFQRRRTIHHSEKRYYHLGCFVMYRVSAKSKIVKSKAQKGPSL